MKRILFFTMCLFFTITTLFSQNYNQVVFTGEGGSDAWEDPENWRRAGDPNLPGVPEPGDDILIDGFNVYFNALGSIPLNQEYGTLVLRNGAYLFTQGDFNLAGNFNVDVSSTFEVIVQDIDLFQKVRCDYFSFVGRLKVNFQGFAPQIGDSFQIIEGTHQNCPQVQPFNNISFDFDTSLTMKCGADGYGLSIEVLGINYTTAISWDGEGNDANWDNPANWDPNGIPNANSRVIINKPGAGGYVRTKGAGITAVANIVLGDNNTLEINGDLLVDKYIDINKGSTFLWNGGKIYSNDVNEQSGLSSQGSIILDSPATKTLDTNFFMIAYGGDINHNQGNLNINNGYVRIFNFNSYNINADNITIGYSSGDRHEFTISVVSKLKKTTGSGTSSINLTNFVNYGKVISEFGTLAFNENATSGRFEEFFDGKLHKYVGTFSGRGGFKWPGGYIMEGVISPGASPGILTMDGDFETSNNAIFEIEIDGPAAGTQYDQIIVTDNAILEGSINVTLGYLPNNDASFQILNAGTLTSCDFPSQISTSYNGIPYTFDVVCQNNTLYLNGPGAVLSVPTMDKEAIEVFPNPVEELLTIRLTKQAKGSWNVYNQLGQQVLNGNLSGIETKITTKKLVSGIYILQIKDENKVSVRVKKIVVSN